MTDTAVSPAARRALVLGGGGATGVAWLVGMIQGFADSGIDLRTADYVIGTSAGSIVGSLAMVGKRHWAEAKMGKALAARDRSRCAALAPSDGLYLVGVDYPDEVFSEIEK